MDILFKRKILEVSFHKNSEHPVLFHAIRSVSQKEPGKISQASKGILRQHINGHRRKQNQCPYFGNYINLGKIE